MLQPKIGKKQAIALIALLVGVPLLFALTPGLGLPFDGFRARSEESFGLVDHGAFFRLEQGISLAVIALMLVPLIMNFSKKWQRKRRIIFGLQLFAVTALLIKPLLSGAYLRVNASDAEAEIRETKCQVLLKTDYNQSLSFFGCAPIAVDRQRLPQEQFAQIQKGDWVLLSIKGGRWADYVSGVRKVAL